MPVGVQIGRGVVRRGGKDVALVAYGTMVNQALAAAEMLAKSGVTATVADMRQATLSTISRADMSSKEYRRTKPGASYLGTHEH